MTGGICAWFGGLGRRPAQLAGLGIWLSGAGQG